MIFKLEVVDRENIPNILYYDNIYNRFLEYSKIDNVFFDFFRLPKEPEKSLIVDITLGFNCNFNCEYCNQETTRKLYGHEKPVPASDIKTFVQTLMKYVEKTYDSGIDVVVLWGGEAYLYFDQIKELVKYLPPEVHINTPTNGSFIKGEIFEFVKKYHITIGLSHDGPCDAFRSNDILSNPELFKNFSYLVKDRNYFVFLSTVNKFNKSHKNVIEFHKELFHTEDIRYNDFRLIAPYTQKVYDDVCVPNEELNAFSTNLYKDLLIESIPQYTHVANQHRKLATHLGVKYDFMFPVPTEGARIQVITDLFGNLLYRHNSHYSRKYTSGEPCSYGNIYTGNEHKVIPQMWQSLYDNECKYCPVLQIADKGCFAKKNDTFLERYKCNIQRARLLPLLFSFITKHLGLYVTSIEETNIINPTIVETHQYAHHQ